MKCIRCGSLGFSDTAPCWNCGAYGSQAPERFELPPSRERASIPAPRHHGARSGPGPRTGASVLYGDPHASDQQRSPYSMIADAIPVRGPYPLTYRPATSDERSLLLAIDDHMTVRELQRVAGLSALEALKALLSLVKNGAVRITATIALPSTDLSASSRPPAPSFSPAERPAARRGPPRRMATSGTPNAAPSPRPQPRKRAAADEWAWYQAGAVNALSPLLADESPETSRLDLSELFVSHESFSDVSADEEDATINADDAWLSTAELVLLSEHPSPAAPADPAFRPKMAPAPSLRPIDEIGPPAHADLADRTPVIDLSESDISDIQETSPRGESPVHLLPLIDASTSDQHPARRQESSAPTMERRSAKRGRTGGLKLPELLRWSIVFFAVGAMGGYAAIYSQLRSSATRRQTTARPSMATTARRPAPPTPQRRILRDTADTQSTLRPLSAAGQPDTSKTPTSSVSEAADSRSPSRLNSE